MKRDSLHWHLPFDQFLDIYNSFEPGQYIMPLDGIIQEESLALATPPRDHFELQQFYNDTFEKALDGLPYLFLHYVLDGKLFVELTDTEMRDAKKKYVHYYYLQFFFRNILNRLKLESLGKSPIDGFVQQFPVTEFLTVRRIKKSGKFETVIVRESFDFDIFDNISLNRLRQCERCNHYFYALKEDKRIKFCSVKCGNAAHQESFQKKKNGTL